ncbi:Longin-like domain-containing protein [Cokeromyces recurvatus]|uniref:Longin-like domain-containing protein n=1 Tax=Cokeromyces recurvatus TaxID=90255 RepID=UPI00221E91F5|nr:Longin-like domain-containing protein [Cokeromyces recurvatus]KAI7906555.1 Longin-like domain-containing protein [Cokeromyces recurvatus]
MVNLSLYSIKAVILLDAEGNRVLAKYYDNEHTTLKQQKQFEKGLFDKTKRAQGEVILYDNQIVLYRSNIDIFFYVVGSMEENELILLSMLNAFYDAVSTLLRYQVEKRAVMDNLDLVILCLDETVDGGIILETDSNAIVSRVSKPRMDMVDIPFSEQTLLQAYQTAKDKFANQLLR